MKHIKSILFTLITASFAAAAVAQNAPPPPPDAKRGPMHGEMQKRWAAADLDKDGQLTKAEAQVGGMSILVTHFDAIDANKDGKISPDEVRAWGKAHRDELRPKGGDDKTRRPPPPPGAGQANPNGAPPPHAFKSPDERRAAMEERFKKADTNGDGALSKAEVQAAGNTRLLDNFDAIDANKDGKITPEEMRSFWQKRAAPPPQK